MSLSNSLISLWDSRFDDSHEVLEASSSANVPQNDARKISAILAAAGRGLRIIYPHQLQPYSHLGAGSCFRVECEIYTQSGAIAEPQLVAVKYLKLPKRAGPETNLFYDGVMRELRVLTHPPFKNHECLIEALAFGWSANTESGIHPYLVVDYSDHGTLAEYLQRITPPVDECRQLALDVAVGLQALHQSGIVHGDLKIDNVLVFNCAGERPQVAKLADFGASIFDVDFADGPVVYRGTARYNAPEQARRTGLEAWRVSQTKEAFRKADIYSMGLLVWEVMNNGDDFCQSEWLKDDETDLHFLDRICENEIDGLLSRALAFCQSRFQNVDQPVIKNAVLDTLQGTLKDEAALRFDIGRLIEALAVGVSKTRPKPVYPRIRSLPIIKDEQAPPHDAIKFPLIRTEGRKDGRSRRQRASDRKISTMETSDYTINVFEESQKIVKARQKPVFKLTAHATKDQIHSQNEVKGLCTIIDREPSPTPGRFRRQNLDIFQVRVKFDSWLYNAKNQVFSSAAFPPWSIQRSIFDDLETQAKDSSMTMYTADAYLQLSLCYHTGFGVEPNAAEVLRCLRRAASLNSVARSIRRRLEIACNDQALMDLGFTTGLDDQIEHLLASPSYFCERFQNHQKSLNANTKQRTWKCDALEFKCSDLDLLDYRSQDHDCHQPCVSVDTPAVIARRDNLLNLAAEVGHTDLVQKLLSENAWNGKEFRTALIKACEYGHFATAQQLSACCPQFEDQPRGPTPLHWLIMFAEDEARQLGLLLVRGCDAEIGSAGGICNTVINAMPPSGSEPHTFPEHCLQLFGSPLHWAVGARSLHLVRLLIELGADVHQRWSFSRAPEFDYPIHQRPSCTPFELAVALHLPEIVDELWQATSYTNQADLLSSSDTFHNIAHVSLPFLRRMMHGANHLQALENTINQLQAWGFDIHRKNALGQSVSMFALADPDQEVYVLEGILAACNQYGETTSDGQNAVTLVACTSSRRQYSLSRMVLAAGIVININDTDSSGWNALHYLAVEDKAKLCELLVHRHDLDINKPNGKGSAAIHIASSFGSCAVLQLLVDRGATLEVLDGDGYSPLRLAVLYRQKGAIRIILAASTDTTMGKEGDASRTSILHIAVSGPSSSDSIAGHILDTYPQFRDPARLNCVDGLGWTPLHRAAYFGDHEGIAALLQYGADSEVRCPRRFPIARGRTALDVTSNLLQRIEAKAALSPDHARITKGGTSAIASFKSRLKEIKIILSKSSKLHSE
ncbi:MAG: hypothetical protein Q9224_001746 [Gallowayella concinna]